MVELLFATDRSPFSPAVCSCRVRAERPSLLDQRFSGDPWIVDHLDGSASVRLGDYALATLALCAFDLTALNRLWTELRYRARH